MVWIVRVVGIRREMDAERAADTEKGAHDMTYTPEQIAAHIAKRTAAVGEDSADVRILRQLVADLDWIYGTSSHVERLLISLWSEVEDKTDSETMDSISDSVGWPALIGTVAGLREKHEPTPPQETPQ